MEGLMRRKPVVPRAEEVGELVAIEAPAVRLGEEGHEARDTAGEPDAVDDAGVCGVGDDHLVPVIHCAKEDVEKGFHSACRDDDLALGVVAMAAPLGGEVGDRCAQVQVAGEGKPAVRLRVVQLGAGRLERLRRKGEIRVEVLHAENGAAVASPRFLCRGSHPVDPEADDWLHPLRPLDHEPELIAGVVSPSGEPSSCPTPSLDRPHSGCMVRLFSSQTWAYGLSL
jgi:hypothetical protein